ncbi:glycoside hydrolase family 2 TIM barrel-domain containing protein [Anaerocolumna jejuensis]|uniref:glycoside hydrolase family 2 TIM barrel-domain containing protein n=1 Tax=Anaerocolumna jejuensis TaxID=259063 RepID=UPI003F7BF8CE
MNDIRLSKWRFHYGDCPEAWYKGFDDSSWEEVSVPHDWSVHMPFSREYSSGTGYLAGGIGWYRTEFCLPEELKGKRIYITFDGMYKNSQVWCNSYYLGKRPFGYATFRYDITSQAVFGDAVNSVSVKLDHRDISDSRWFTGSGIIRKAVVTAEEPVHTEYNGIFFTTPEVSKEKAAVKVFTPLVNETSEEAEVTLTHSLVVKDESFLSFRTKLSLSAGERREVTLEDCLPSPKLWSVKEPHLYKLVTEIKASQRNGSLISTQNYETMVGIRSLLFTPDKGFFLNGEPLKLKGVCIHHDAGCLGAAVLPSVWLRRLESLKEMGCNSIRMSHNPHMPELYDLCDAMGFLVMDEAFDEWENPKNKWWNGHNVYPPRHQGYAEDFPQWHERDLTDLIRRDRNHPSIILWSIGNEIDYPNDPYCHPLFETMTGNNDKDKPAAERQYNPNKPNAERLSVLAGNLTAIVKQSDTTRPVTAAVAFPELSTRIGYIDALDVAG